MVLDLRSVDVLTKDLVQAITVFGALVAASVAFISFWFNYRATMRNQRDTQFFEALKRFGDEHPTLRTSAGALLAQHAKFGSGRWWLEFDRRAPYFMTTLNQLVAGLALEDEPVVAAAIVATLEQLATIEPHRVAMAVTALNVALQHDLLRTIAAYCATHRATATPAIDGALRELSAIASYEPDILARMIQRHDESLSEKRPSAALKRKPFAVMIANARLELDAVSRADVPKRRQDTLRALALTSSRLAATVEVIAFAICAARPVIRLQQSFALGLGRTARYKLPPEAKILNGPIDVRDAFLVHADLARRKLNRIDFARAQLDGADFSGSDIACLLRRTSVRGADFRDSRMDAWSVVGQSLEGARLAGAAVRLDSVSRYAMQWFEADFSFDDSPNAAGIDQDLLVLLFEFDVTERIRAGHGDVEQFFDNGRFIRTPNVPIHPSVATFLEEARTRDPVPAVEAAWKKPPPSDPFAQPGWTLPVFGIGSVAIAILMGALYGYKTVGLFGAFFLALWLYGLLRHAMPAAEMSMPQILSIAATGLFLLLIAAQSIFAPSRAPWDTAWPAFVIVASVCLLIAYFAARRRALLTRYSRDGDLN